jgi:chromosome segregation protein
MLDSLEAGESVVTPEGIWLGPGWLRQVPAGEGEAGLLQREQEIRELDEKIAADAKAVETIEQRLAASRAELSEHEARAREGDGAIHERQRERAQIHGQLTGINSRLETLERQRSAAETERKELAGRQEEDTRAVGQARTEMQQALDAMEKAEAGREPLRQEKSRLDEARDAARRDQREARERRESLSLKLESGRAGLESLRQSIARMDNQVGQLQSAATWSSARPWPRAMSRCASSRKSATGCWISAWRSNRVCAKHARKLESLEANWREQDQARQAASAESDEIREEQSQRQLALKETQLKSQSLSERIEELEENLETLLADLPEGAATEQYQRELEKLEEKIRGWSRSTWPPSRKFEAESERKAYLDRQNADLAMRWKRWKRPSPHRPRHAHPLQGDLRAGQQEHGNPVSAPVRRRSRPTWR